MREVRYKSSSCFGVEADFTRIGMLLESTAPLVSSGIGYTVTGRSVTNIARVAREVTLTLFSNNPKEFERCRQLIESDVVNGQAGVIECDGWQAKAFGVEVEVGDIHSALHLECSIKFVLVDGYWRKPTIFNYYRQLSSADGESLDYEHNYPYDYGKTKQVYRLTSPVSYPAKMTLTIYGAAVNPTLRIGNNSYVFDVTIPDGGRLICDASSTNKSIKAYTADGIETNVINKGRREGGVGGGMYCFEPIPAGTHLIQCDGSFNFDIAVWEERGGLPWM